MQEINPRSISKGLSIRAHSEPCPDLAAPTLWVRVLWFRLLGHTGAGPGPCLSLKLTDQQRLKHGKGLMNSCQKPWTQDHHGH